MPLLLNVLFVETYFQFVIAAGEVKSSAVLNVEQSISVRKRELLKENTQQQSVVKKMEEFVNAVGITN